MWLIILLILVGVLLLVVELVLLAGLSIAGICAFISYVAAVYIAFTTYGVQAGIYTIGGIVAASIIATVIALRSKTWERLSLKQNIEGMSQELPANNLKPGDRGTALTRLAPVGKIEVDGQTYEAKSLADLYIDQRTEVEVVWFENFTVIVRTIN